MKKCKQCNGIGIEGFDRSYPPGSYVCGGCNGTGIIINNNKEYDRALKEAQKLLDLNPEIGTCESFELDKLVRAIENYEDIHYPISEM